MKSKLTKLLSTIIATLSAMSAKAWILIALVTATFIAIVALDAYIAYKSRKALERQQVDDWLRIKSCPAGTNCPEYWHRLTNKVSQAPEFWRPSPALESLATNSVLTMTDDVEAALLDELENSWAWTKLYSVTPDGPWTAYDAGYGTEASVLRDCMDTLKNQPQLFFRLVRDEQQP